MDFLRDLDYSLFNSINKTWANSFFDSVLPHITDLYKTPVFLAFVIIVFGFWIYSHQKKSVVLILGVLVTVGVTDLVGAKLLKESLQRRRPEFSGLDPILRTYSHVGWSMPSNHALNSFAVAMFLSMAFPRARWLLFGVATAIAYSRIYIGVHFPSDVIVGGTLGACMGYLIFRATQKLSLRRGIKI